MPCIVPVVLRMSFDERGTLQDDIRQYGLVARVVEADDTSAGIHRSQAALSPAAALSAIQQLRQMNTVPNCTPIRPDFAPYFSYATASAHKDQPALIRDSPRSSHRGYVSQRGSDVTFQNTDPGLL